MFSIFRVFEFVALFVYPSGFLRFFNRFFRCLTVNIHNITISIFLDMNQGITWHIITLSIWMFSIFRVFEFVTLFIYPSGFLRFFNRFFRRLTVNVDDISVLVLVDTDKFVTWHIITLVIWMFAIFRVFELVTLFVYPSCLFDFLVDIDDVTVFVLVDTNKFITWHVIAFIIWMFAIFRVFKLVTLFVHPSGFLRFFNRFFRCLPINVNDISVLIFVDTN